MHYRDGTEAKVGDFVKGKQWDGKTIVGQVTSLTPGSTSCNMNVIYTVMAPQGVSACFTVGEFDLMHRDGAPTPDA